MKRFTLRGILFSFLAGALFASGFWLGHAGPPVYSQAFSTGTSSTTHSFGSAPEGQKANAPITPVPSSSDSLIADMVQQTGPAVVRIETKVARQTNQTPDSFFFGPFSFDLPQAQPSGAIGSGFFISEDGTILTNNHVIDGATDIKVYMNDKDKGIPAKIIGRDPELDLAVLKVTEAGKYPYLALGDSDATKVGNWVVAIGNPFGLDHTVTVGVLSAKGRPLTIEGKQFKNLLQTDASINPGNSGGPLLDLNGKVIGINTAINAQGQGLGFAVPINSVKEVLNDLLTHGKVSRPWLGVGVQDMNAQIADYFNLNVKTGAFVTQVVDGSPAAKAGLAPYDVIVGFGGQDVKDAQTLVDMIQKTKVGESKKLLVNRKGEMITLTVTIGEKNYAQ